MKLNLRSIDLNLLTVFDALIAEGNMSRAAQKIGMSQPAMSLAISRFRHIAKDDLFESNGRGVKPTPRALQLAGPVRRALELVSRALEQNIEFDIYSSERCFNVALSDVGEALLLPQLMEHLSELQSPMQINTVSTANIDVSKEIHFGKIDVFAWIEPHRDEDFTSQQMGTFTEVCLVREDHPTVGNTISLEEYTKLKHLVLNMGEKHGPSSIDKDLWAKGLERKNVMSIHSYHVAPKILSMTDMVCSMPIALARYYCELHPLKMVASPTERTLPAFLVWHSTMDSDPAHRWVREYLIHQYSLL